MDSIHVRTKVDPKVLSEALDEIWTSEGKGAASPFEVSVEKSGSAVDLTTLLIAAGPIAGMVFTDVWKNILLPRLKQRFGVNAIEVAGERPQ